MSALNELDEYISRNDPSYSFPRRASVSQAVVAKDSFHHSTLLSDVDGLLESLASRRTRMARGYRNMQRLAELDDVTDGDDLTTRSFSLTLSPGANDDSGDSFDIQSHRQRFATKERSPQRRHSKQTRSRVHHSREFTELRAFADTVPEKTTASRSTEHHPPEGQSFAAFERYLDTQSHMLKELTSSITALQQNLSSRSVEVSGSVGGGGAAAAHSADRSTSTNTSTTRERLDTSRWEQHHQPPQLSSSFQKKHAHSHIPYNRSTSLAMTHPKPRLQHPTPFSVAGTSQPDNVSAIAISSRRPVRRRHRLPASALEMGAMSMEPPSLRNTAGWSYHSSLGSRSAAVSVPQRARYDRPQTPTSEPGFAPTPSPDSVEPVTKPPLVQAEALHDLYASSTEHSVSHLSRRSGSGSSGTSHSGSRRRAFIQVHSTPERAKSTHTQSPVSERAEHLEPEDRGAQPHKASLATAGVQTSVSISSGRSSFTSDRSASDRSAQSRQYVPQHDDASIGSFTSRSASSVKSRSDPHRSSSSRASAGAEPEADALESGVRQSQSQIQAQPVADQSEAVPSDSTRLVQPPLPPPPPPKISTHPTLPERNSSPSRRTGIQAPKITHMPASTQPAPPQHAAGGAMNRHRDLFDEPRSNTRGAMSRLSAFDSAHQDDLPPFEHLRPRFEEPVLRQASSPPYQPRASSRQHRQLSESEFGTNNGRTAAPRRTARFDDQVPMLEESFMSDDSTDIPPESVSCWKSQHEELLKDMQKLSEDIDSVLRGRPPIPPSSTQGMSKPSSATAAAVSQSRIVSTADTSSRHGMCTSHDRPPRPASAAPTRHAQRSNLAPAASDTETARYIPGPLPLWATSPVRSFYDDDGDRASTASRDSLNEATGVIGELLKTAP